MATSTGGMGWGVGKAFTIDGIPSRACVRSTCEEIVKKIDLFDEHDDRGSVLFGSTLFVDCHLWLLSSLPGTPPETRKPSSAG
jgi:hypothetical protein